MTAQVEEALRAQRLALRVEAVPLQARVEEVEVGHSQEQARKQGAVVQDQGLEPEVGKGHLQLLVPPVQSPLLVQTMQWRSPVLSPPQCSTMLAQNYLTPVQGL